MDRLLWYLFAGSRGGPTRIRVLRALLEEPRNLHQLAKALGLDYKTVEYQIRVLRKHVMVAVDDPSVYGAVYFPSKTFLASRAAFDEIVARVATKQAKQTKQTKQVKQAPATRAPVPSPADDHEPEAPPRNAAMRGKWENAEITSETDAGRDRWRS